MTTPTSLRAVRWLPRLAVLECLTVLVLFGNMATAHSLKLAAAIGRHGAMYLSTIAAAWLAPLRQRSKWLPAVPLVGGIAVVLVTRQPAVDHSGRLFRSGGALNGGASGD